MRYTALHNRLLCTAFCCVVMSGCASPPDVPPSQTTVPPPIATRTPSNPASTVGSSDIQTYCAKVAPILRNAGELMQQISASNTRAAQSPALLQDPNWRTQILSQFALLDVNGDRVGSIAPVPPDARSLQESLLQMAQEERVMSRSYAHAIDTLDQADLDTAVSNLNHFAALTSEIRHRADALMEQTANPPTQR